MENNVSSVIEKMDDPLNILSFLVCSEIFKFVYILKLIFKYILNKINIEINTVIYCIFEIVFTLNYLN